MVINARGAVKAMKEDAKLAGYQVGIQGTGENRIIVLHGAGWMIETVMKKCPTEVLAQIVKDCGFLPDSGECYNIKKDMAQKAVAEEFWKGAASAILGLEDPEENPGWQTKYTGLVYGGSTVLMKNRNGVLVPVQQRLLDIGSMRPDQTVSNGTVVLFVGKVSRVAVSAWTRENLPVETLRRINEAIKIEWEEEE